jgi:hypothetical protein
VTALDSAMKTLAWAVDPAGPPPVGTLRQVATLHRPGAAAAKAIGWLATVTAARLGAGSPPLGDTGSVGPGTLLLAAAVGGRAEMETATALLDAVPQLPNGPGRWVDMLTRHAVVGPVLDDPPPLSSIALPRELRDALRRKSPLTAVLSYPGRGQTDAARAIAAALLGQPHGAGVLHAAVAAPSSDSAVLTWRAQLLEQLRHEHPRYALEVYLTARLWHGAAWDERIAWAGRELAGLGSPDDLPIAILRYWAPLARMYRDEEAIDPQRSILALRVYLRPAQVRPVLRLVSQHRLLRETGVA